VGANNLGDIISTSPDHKIVFLIFYFLTVPKGGPETPEGLLPPTRSSAVDDNFQKGVNKIQNLDFKATKESLKLSSNLEDAQKTQEQKNKAAALYRAKLLKEQQQQKSATQGAPEMSPGYRREKATDRHAKKQKADRKGAAQQQHGSINKHVDTSKATVLQCVFNFSNILMVRFQGFSRVVCVGWNSEPIKKWPVSSEILKWA
jgi:hypothetical protein